MFRDKEFLMKELGIGKGTREDTFFILGYFYDNIKDNGYSDIIIGKFLYLRDYLNKHRELINYKNYNILQLTTFIDRICLILNKYQYEVPDKDTILLKIENNEIVPIVFDVKIDKEIIVEKKEKEKKKEEVIKEEEPVILEENLTYKSKGNNIETCTGVYGIYADDKLVYIGRTIAGFKQRYKSHLKELKENNSFLYRRLREYKDAGCEIRLKPLIVLEKLEMVHKKTINIKELNCMEFALITVLQPELNVEGRLKPYVFRNR